MPSRDLARRWFITHVVLVLFAAPLAAEAQQVAKVWRIGYIQTASPEEQKHLTKALEEGLWELGYAEGRNVVFERRFAWGNQERLPALAAELVQLKVDVIVTGANPVIAAVQHATATIPVVMATSRDPVGSGTRPHDPTVAPPPSGSRYRMTWGKDCAVCVCAAR